MKKFHNVETEDIFNEFCFNRKIRPSTVSSYKNALQKYSNFTNKTLDELIIEAEIEEDSGLRLKRRKINKCLREFELSLYESNLSRDSVNLIMLLVKSFYRHNDIELPRMVKKGVNETHKLETIDDLPTMDEIRRFMEYCNNVYKAMVVMCLSSGMGASEVTSLTFKHLYKAISIKQYHSSLDQLIEELKAKSDFIPSWEIIRIKKNREYITFSSPESISRIIIYLEELQNKHPDYKPELSDKLFRSLNTNNPLKANSFTGIFVYINKAHFFRKTENNKNLIKSHSLRKLFASILESNGVSFLTIRRLLGHSTGPTIQAYFKVNIDSLKEEYSKVVKYLITTEQDVIVIDNLEELKEEVDDLKKLVTISGKLDPAYRDFILKEELKRQHEFDQRSIEV